MVEPAHAVHASSAHASTAEGQEALADASPQVAQLQRLQALADGGPLGTLQCKTPEEDEQLQGCFRTVQRQSPEEEELLQGQFATTPATPAPNRTGMPDALKSGIEALSGLAMDHLRVHYNSETPPSSTPTPTPRAPTSTSPRGRIATFPMRPGTSSSRPRVACSPPCCSTGVLP